MRPWRPSALLLLLALAAGCGSEVDAVAPSTATSATATTSTTSTTALPPTTSTTTAVGPEWLPTTAPIEAARTDRGGAALVVTFVSGPPFVAGERCTVGLRLEVEESAAEVALRLLARPHDELPEPGEPVACPAVGALHTLRVDLGAPLGDRDVVDPDGGRVEVFDGAALATIGELPEGWSVRHETYGFGPAGTTTTDRWWARLLAPPDDDACGGPAAVVILTEGPPELEPRGPELGRHDVRGNTAVHAGDGSQHWLEWLETGRSYGLTTFAGCNETEVGIEELLRIARGLQIPTS